MEFDEDMRMKSREHETSKGLTEKSVSLRASLIRKSIDYCKVENPLYVAQHHEPRKSAGDNDLVKHVRSLPGYLQRVEKCENIQGKALNFGVLDWGRLENWKSNEKRILPRYNMKAPFAASNPNIGSTRFSRTIIKTLPLQKDQQAPKSFQLNSSYGDRLPPGVRWPRGKAVKVKNFENGSMETSSSDWRKHGMGLSENIDSGINVIPFSPGVSPRCSCHDLRLSESRNPHQCKLTEVNERRLSDCFSSEEFDCVKPSSATPSKGRSLKDNKSVLEHVTTVEASKKTDMDMEKHSSPNRRFSFSIGKMTRSFSFKESSSLPQLSSTCKSVKSGPIKLEAAPDVEDHDWNKGSATSRVSSSPLRRLLDPLLKHKGTHSAERVQKSKALIQGKKHKSSNVQALVQLTTKNGVPFFKLVVDSSNDILAAAIKKLPTSGKGDSSLTYAFYSVHEIKKKSGGWINQGKSCGFGYDTIGQMKISSSYHAEFSGPEKDLFVIRESVLYSTDSMIKREIGAIVVKNSSDESSGDIGRSKDLVVILPGGVHSMPNSGQPSPLIDRWRSGGICDCGGWDIGCQLQILTNQNEMVKIPSASTSNRLDLCYQGVNENKETLSLALLEDGLYSLEHNASISLLQAFSICVAVVSSQKLTHIFQVNYLQESNDFSKPVISADEKVKGLITKIPPTYVSKPPVSPVGRV